MTAIFSMLPPSSGVGVAEGREERFLESGIPAPAMTWIVMPAGNSPVQESWDCSLPLVAEPLILAPASKAPGTLGFLSLELQECHGALFLKRCE